MDKPRKTAVNLSPYKIVQKDSLFYLFGHPIDTEQNLVVDLKNNNVLFYKQGSYFSQYKSSRNQPFLEEIHFIISKTINSMEKH